MCSYLMNNIFVLYRDADQVITEWHSMDLKISLTVRPFFLDHESEEANQVELPTSV
jgi:hypothetical protein